MSLRATTLLLAAIALAACGDAADIPSGVDVTDDFGRIRFVNAVADPTIADRVNVNVDGVPLGVNLAYGGVSPTSPNYYPAYEGAREFVVQRTADTTVHVLDEAVTVTADTSHTVYAVLDAGTPTAFVTLDNTTLPAGDSVKLRIVHLASAKGNVDVYVTAPNASLTALTPTLADVAPLSASDYLRLPRATYQVRFTTAGTKTVVLSSTVTAPSGSAPYIRTVVALDPIPPATAATAVVLTDR